MKKISEGWCDFHKNFQISTFCRHNSIFERAKTDLIPCCTLFMYPLLRYKIVRWFERNFFVFLRKKPSLVSSQTAVSAKAAVMSAKWRKTVSVYDSSPTRHEID